MLSCGRFGRILCAVTGIIFVQCAANGQSLPNLFPFPNATGLLETYNTAGDSVSLTGPFFQCLVVRHE